MTAAASLFPRANITTIRNPSFHCDGLISFLSPVCSEDAALDTLGILICQSFTLCDFIGPLSICLWLQFSIF